MHELSLATNIVEIIENNLANHPGAKVHSVTVDVGTHSGVEIDALEFCFPIACEKTQAEGTTLILKTVPLTIDCDACGTKNQETKNLVCPQCSSPLVTVIKGKDMIVSSIDLDVE